MKKFFVCCFTLLFCLSFIGQHFSYGHTINRTLNDLVARKTSEGIVYTSSDGWDCPYRLGGYV